MTRIAVSALVSGFAGGDWVGAVTLPVIELITLASPRTFGQKVDGA